MVLPSIAIPWIVILGAVEQRFGVHFDLNADWHWDDDLIDIVRWVGWIPLALWARRRILSRSSDPPIA